LPQLSPNTSNFKDQSEVVKVWQNKFTPEAVEILVWPVNAGVPRSLQSISLIYFLQQAHKCIAPVFYSIAHSQQHTLSQLMTF
jgi:hypothetical protein